MPRTCLSSHMPPRTDEHNRELEAEIAGIDTACEDLRQELENLTSEEVCEPCGKSVA